MQLIQERYDILNGSQAYTRCDLNPNFTPLVNDIDNLLKATDEGVTVIVPVNVCTVIERRNELKLSPYKIKEGCYCIVFDDEEFNPYCIVHCYKQDGVKTVHSIICLGNTILQYAMCDGENESIFKSSNPMLELVIGVLLLQNEINLPTYRLKDNGVFINVFGHDFIKYWSRDVTIIDYENV